MNFTEVKSLTIPEGVVLNICIDDKTVWRKYFINKDNFLYELSEDKKYYSVVGVEEGITTYVLKDTINGLPIIDIDKDAFLEKSELTISMTSNVNLSEAPWGAKTPKLYIDGIRYRVTTTSSRKPQYVCDAPSSKFNGGVVNILGSIGSIIVSEIDAGSFKGYTNITEVNIPKEIKWIETAVFQNCINLKKATFYGTPSSIYSTTFNGCTNLIEINVPWAEGAVDGAPWGATNATINYNYVGD